MPEYTHHVKCKEIADETWAFLSRNGTTRLRVHALKFTGSGALQTIKDIAPDNPGWVFKAVPIDPKVKSKPSPTASQPAYLGPDESERLARAAFYDSGSPLDRAITGHGMAHKDRFGIDTNPDRLPGEPMGWGLDVYLRVARDLMTGSPHPRSPA